MISPQSGGFNSISQAPSAQQIHARAYPCETNSSSRPGGIGSGISVVPEINLIKQVPQVPDVQFLGMMIPASSAISKIGTSS